MTDKERIRIEALRAALEDAREFMESVTEWVGCDPDEHGEVLQALAAALRADDEAARQGELAGSALPSSEAAIRRAELSPEDRKDLRGVLEQKRRHLEGRREIGCDLTLDEQLFLMAMWGHGVSPPPATVEGLADFETEGDPSIAVGLTWAERVEMYEAALTAEPSPEAREAARGVLAEVVTERNRQEALVASGKFSMTCAHPDEDPHRAISVLVEEVGEVSRATLEGDVAQTRRELIEVAAVAVAMVEGIDARRSAPDVQAAIRDELVGGS